MFKLIVGPCAIESEEMAMDIAEKMKAITDKLGIDYTFKGSFDKYQFVIFAEKYHGREYNSIKSGRWRACPKQ